MRKTPLVEVVENFVQDYPFSTYIENGLKLEFHFAIDLTTANGEQPSDKNKQ